MDFTQNLRNELDFYWDFNFSSYRGNESHVLILWPVVLVILCLYMLKWQLFFYTTDSPALPAKRVSMPEKSLYQKRGSYALLDELDPDTDDVEDSSMPVVTSDYYNVQMKRIMVENLLEKIQEKKLKKELNEEFDVSSNSIRVYVEQRDRRT